MTEGALVGGAAALVLLIGLARYLLLDKSAVGELRRDLTDLRLKVDRLEHELNEQRGLKHKALSDLAVARGVLHMVKQLAQECTCGALHPIELLMTQTPTSIPQE